MKKSLLWLAVLLVAAGCSPNRPETNAPTEQTPEAAHLAWVPQPLDTFQIQFNGEPDPYVDADLFELDLFDSEHTTIDRLHTGGRKVLCYINAGAVEDWRPDFALYPAETLGKAYAGWPGEYWLDIRALEALRPLLEARLDLCLAKGFDGVDFDNVDSWQNETGFDLTAADQLSFNRWLADAAHRRGLAVGLKNDPEQIASLEPWFDFAVLESCFSQGWCDQARPFIDAHKAVFDIEYSSITPYCDQAGQTSISLIEKRLELDAERTICQ